MQLAIQQGIEELALVLQQLSEAIANSKSFVYLDDLDRAIEALNHQQNTLRVQMNQSILSIKSTDHTALASLSKR